MKLTNKNYFTAKNNHISNSDISNWKKCKNYFYKKKVTREIVQPITDALVIGSAVDEWLTVNMGSYGSKYQMVKRRTNKDDENYRYQLTGKMVDEIEGMCTAVEATEAYKELMFEGIIDCPATEYDKATNSYKEVIERKIIKRHKSQQILQYDFPIGEHFLGICNIPDWYIIDKKTGVCTITDLKTAKAFNGSKTKWHWKCVEFGYYRQQAMAQKILKLLHPEITSFQSRHLIVEKDPDGIHNVYAWIISQDRIDDAMIELNETLEDIHNEINFNKLPASWSEDDVVGEYE